MIIFPNAKINIGLNIVSRRDDGFHNIETIFFPVKGLCDILEVATVPEQEDKITFDQTGLTLNEPNENNLCVKAYHLLNKYINLPHVSMHLHKQIPFGAGLGGGSSDGAHALMALNSLSSNPLQQEKLIEVALLLGSDCPFFIYNSPCYATSRGEKLTPLEFNLDGVHLLLINPGLHINTGKAYSLSKPQASVYKLPHVIKNELKNWRDTISNDFEKVVFDLYPEIGIIKDELYSMGALYSAMSGSGSTVFGIFKEKPQYELSFSEYYTFYQKL